MSTAKAILKAADFLFGRDGYAATGVLALAEEAGVTKRTLYKHFGSKDGLFLAWLQLRDQNSFALVFEAAEAIADTPKDRILQVFGNLGLLAGQETYFGCPFSRAILDFSGATDHDAQQAALHHKGKIAEWFEAQLTACGKPASAETVETLLVLYEGVLMRIAASRSSDPSKAARRAVEMLLKEAPHDD